MSTQAHAAETSVAFGFSLKSCRHLLEAAKELGLQVVGVSFHVPPSCQDLEEAYTHALSDARCVFDMGVSETLLTLQIPFFTVSKWDVVPFTLGHITDPSDRLL